jgi:hypothetical protein
MTPTGRNPALKAQMLSDIECWVREKYPFYIKMLTALTSSSFSLPLTASFFVQLFLD